MFLKSSQHHDLKIFSISIDIIDDPVEKYSLMIW